MFYNTTTQIGREYNNEYFNNQQNSNNYQNQNYFSYYPYDPYYYNNPYYIDHNINYDDGSIVESRPNSNQMINSDINSQFNQMIFNNPDEIEEIKEIKDDFEDIKHIDNIKDKHNNAIHKKSDSKQNVK